MAVSPIINESNIAARQRGAMGDSVEDLMNNFMTLLVAQMQNQDPTNPMDNNQLTSQLTQFQTAAGVQQLNSTVNTVGMLVTSMQQMNATQWIGRSVLLEGDTTVSNAEGGNQTMAFSASGDADVVNVILTDAQGNAWTAELKPVKAGVQQFTLDSLDNFQPSDPRTIENGVFSVSYSAASADGSTPEIVALKKAQVQGVSYTPTGAVLELGLQGNATLGEIYLVE
ncbi:flagellar hook assembly protein FlgD [Entomohabitans teleogrylli]|uniref:flagellar hook assembly protein FlgD n=1 Tax=Entomohabitans teleogrylli TaxID=1384589 RepID=UPI00073DA806|nr:flagellar hook capping FlgD N-terminal domain-containing protein [Entomohabitans teleogrylli]